MKDGGIILTMTIREIIKKQILMPTIIIHQASINHGLMNQIFFNPHLKIQELLQWQDSSFVFMTGQDKWVVHTRIQDIDALDSQKKHLSPLFFRESKSSLIHPKEYIYLTLHLEISVVKYSRSKGQIHRDWVLVKNYQFILNSKTRKEKGILK